MVDIYGWIVGKDLEGFGFSRKENLLVLTCNDRRKPS
jgi:hypothetical protein